MKITVSQKRLPYTAYTLPVFFLILLGIADTLYLAASHYRNYTDVDYSSFCAISQAINCDTVSQSPWSIFLGIPLAFWGLFLYLIFFILILPAMRNTKDGRYLWDLLFILALGSSIADIYLGYVSAKKIHAYCIMCLLSYIINFSILFIIWIIRRRFNTHTLFTGLKNSFATLWQHKSIFISLCCIILLLGLLKFILPQYWIFSYPVPSREVATGITKGGNPWIGAKYPLITIEEFTDYQCFQCSKMHLMLRLLVNRHPKKLRLVHHHYPMDSKFNYILVKKPFHEGSGKLAMLAIAAEKQGKFWQANDGLYSIVRHNIKEFTIQKFAKKLGLDPKKLKKDMYSKETLKLLEQDIRKGLKNKIIGTPSFLINGTTYAGHLPPELLQRLAQ